MSPNQPLFKSKEKKQTTRA